MNRTPKPNGGSSRKFSLLSRTKWDNGLRQLEITIPEEIGPVRVQKILVSTDDFCLTWLELFRKYNPSLYEYLYQWQGRYVMRSSKTDSCAPFWLLIDPVKEYFKVFTTPMPVYYAVLAKRAEKIVDSSASVSAVAEAPRAGPSGFVPPVASPILGPSGTCGTAVMGREPKSSIKPPTVLKMKKGGPSPSPYSRKKGLTPRKKVVTFSPDLELELSVPRKAKAKRGLPSCLKFNYLKSDSDSDSDSDEMEEMSYGSRLEALRRTQAHTEFLLRSTITRNFLERVDSATLDEVHRELVGILDEGRFRQATGSLPKTGRMLVDVFGLNYYNYNLQ